MYMYMNHGLEEGPRPQCGKNLAKGIPGVFFLFCFVWGFLGMPPSRLDGGHRHAERKETCNELYRVDVDCGDSFTLIASPKYTKPDFGFSRKFR